MVQIKSALAGIPVSRAMMTDFRTLSAHDTLSDAVALVRAGAQQDFPILENGQLVGVLTRGDLIAALTRSDGERSVADVMRREFQVTDSHEMLEGAFSRLQSCACHTLPVTHDAASDARKTATLAISSGAALRPRQVMRSMVFSRSPVSGRRSARSTLPGHRALQRMPSLP